jgi:hypothetical protein
MLCIGFTNGSLTPADVKEHYGHQCYCLYVANYEFVLLVNTTRSLLKESGQV